ncbi:amidohydrolase 2 [Caballeronia udeis]|uniref:Amidohydrolase 2 n=1 Tax=Caballeronia udeis TaxID=1232866 RepID=A0A158JUI4_9BURK|nr:amidohydrolase family protein [Caballeronia udeis]SAL72365.1 amidohydrolase 2 [Caballeronia udeis]
MNSRRIALKAMVAGVAGMAIGSPTFAHDQNEELKKLRSLMPVNSCDCHSHIVGPYDKYPMVESRAYTPPMASVSELRKLHKELGIDRSVLIQPSFYGTDNRCLLDALRELGPSSRGVAVVAPDATEAELDNLKKSGIVGIRINQPSGPRDSNGLSALIDRAGRQAAELGWHVQVFLPMRVIGSLAPTIERSPAPFVLDHYAGAKAEGTTQDGFDAVLGLLKSGKAYAKLSAPYHEAHGPIYAGMAELALEFINANPERVLWGSDWPHTPWIRNPADSKLTVTPFFHVDNAELLERFLELVPEQSVKEKILVHNPETLFHFAFA